MWVPSSRRDIGSTSTWATPTVVVLTALLSVLFVVSACGGGEEGPPLITVDSTADSDSRDGVLTLREALLVATGELAVANLDPEEADNIKGAPGAESGDTIVFDVSVFPPSEPATISLASPLPALATEGDSVDGSQAGVIVDGVNQTFDCFQIDSAGNAIRGLHIQGCLTAVVLGRSAQNNIIGGAEEGEGNVISANDQGVLLAAEGTNSNQVIGNLIGTDGSGTKPNGNRIGVMIRSGARDNVIGGSNTGERNIISGQRAVGVTISGSDNLVIGNYIGTDITGTVSISNRMEGIWITDGAQGNVVGGTSPGEGNVISGNALFGVSITGSGTSGNVVKGNYIGVDATGAAALGNRHGVDISWGAEDNIIGGSAEGEGNIISANNTGVLLRGYPTKGNVVEGNYIGTDASGETALRNARAISIIEGAEDNTVGPNVIED